MANINSEILKRWLQTIPPVDRERVFSRLYEECLVTKHTFHNWRYGLCRIPLSGLRDINKVTKEYSGYEIFEIVMPGVTAEA